MCKFIIACLISLSALSFSSCTQKKVATSVAYMDFPQTIELKARVQPLDTALFRYPFRVRVQGDKAVVMDLHGTDYFCLVRGILKPHMCVLQDDLRYDELVLSNLYC